LKSRNIVFLTILYLWLPSIIYSQSPDLDYDHWIYDFINRIEAKGVFTKFDAGMKPYSRQEIANLLQQIDQHVVQNKKPELSKKEKALLEQFKGEFADELADKNVKINNRYRERHPIRWQEGNNRLYLDFRFDQQLDLKTGDQFETGERVSKMTLGGILRGDFTENFSFLVDVRNQMSTFKDSVDEQFNPSQGQPVVTTGSRAFSDKAVAYLNWKLPWFSLKMGRDRLKWGPGHRGGLIISANNPLFDMILLQTRFKRFNFQYFHGFLNSQYQQKYFVAHRVELKAWDWLYLSGSETVIYGNRGVEMQYLNPLMPYHVAEHHLGDLDNNMMGMDISAYPFKNQKYYFELLLDDFSSSEGWFSYIGNKFGFMFGGYWVEPFKIPDVDLRIEYTRVEPFTYTHYDSVNTYLNYDEIIGYWSGPNSDVLFVEMNYLLFKDVHLKFSWEQVRRGTGDVFTFPTETDGDRKYFLKGTVERQHIYAFQIKDQLFRDVFLSFRSVFVKTNNLGKVAGLNSFDKQFLFNLSIDY